MAILRELRLERLLSQNELARLAGVSRTTIVAIERNQHNPQPLTLHKLAKALKVNPTDIDCNDRTK
jgi:putative transcriptional regulator